MTNEQLKKKINYQSQVCGFALGLLDEYQNDEEWTQFSMDLLDTAYHMIKSINKSFEEKGCK